MGLSKIAFFVEGYTEQEFLKRLLEEIFGQKKVAIEVKSARGGSRVAVSYTTIKSAIATDETKYFVLIYNCNGDSGVKSYILEQRESLISAGYSKVIGLRDVYPDVERKDIYKLWYGLNLRVPQKPVPISFVLSVMETESWFLAEDTHYERINHQLTVDFIKSNCNFNPLAISSENVDQAAELLKNIYQSVGMTYKKEEFYIDRTINALDFSNMYFTVRNRNVSLDNIIRECEALFS